MNREKEHEFHFIIAAAVREELSKLVLDGRIWCLSTLIVKIIRLMDMVLVKLHLSKVEYESRYQRVDENPEMTRKSVHVYLPPEMYRRLKLMHQDLNLSHALPTIACVILHSRISL